MTRATRIPRSKIIPVLVLAGATISLSAAPTAKIRMFTTGLRAFTMGNVTAILLGSAAFYYENIKNRLHTGMDEITAAINKLEHRDKLNTEVPQAISKPKETAPRS